MHIHRTPWLLRTLFPQYLWRVNDSEKIFLTFDDGPIPELTPWVLDTLKEFGVKATFFCVGNNIEKHPDIFARLLDEGHLAANHTHNHLKGWKTATDKYLENTLLCESYLRQDKKLFRPPYGRISSAQAKELRKDYQIVMWDVLSCDYSPSLNEKDCLQATLRYTRAGSIVVFHDNIKASRNIRYTLPRYIEAVLKSGKEFDIF